MVLFRWLLFILTFVSVCEAKPVVRLANGEWPPYQSKLLHLYGFVSQIIVEAFAEEGYEVEFEFLPWVRGLERAKSGQLDGSFIWAYSPQKEQHFIYSEPILYLTTSLFHRLGTNIQWNNYEELSKYSLGGVVGYIYGLEELEQEGVLHIQRISNETGNYHKLVAGRLDVVLEDTLVGYHHIRELDYQDKVIEASKTLNGSDYGLLIAKSSPRAKELLSAFNRGLAKLKADGRIEKYVEDSKKGKYIKNSK